MGHELHVAEAAVALEEPAVRTDLITQKRPVARQYKASATRLTTPCIFSWP